MCNCKNEYASLGDTIITGRMKLYNPWNKVSDGFPKKFKDVITWGKDTKFDIHEYDGDNWVDSMGWTPSVEITHWRELPEKPEEDQL